MSMKPRRITANTFRKFRTPITIDGLTDGINVAVEPNETGKSTLLEAIRSACFVPHRSSIQLTRSYQPFGENVAPEVEISFDVAGASRTVSRRFLKSQSMEVWGRVAVAGGTLPKSSLRHCSGSRKTLAATAMSPPTARSDCSWVGQVEALAVSAPGCIVRDTIQATLEAEGGTILGGAAYERGRDRVDQQFAAFWTAKGVPSGEQKAARERLDQMRLIECEAASNVELLEKSVAELEATRGRLVMLRREGASPSPRLPLRPCLLQRQSAAWKTVSGALLKRVRSLRQVRPPCKRLVRAG